MSALCPATDVLSYIVSASIHCACLCVCLCMSVCLSIYVCLFVVSCSHRCAVLHRINKQTLASCDEGLRHSNVYIKNCQRSSIYLLMPLRWVWPGGVVIKVWYGPDSPVKTSTCIIDQDSSPLSILLSPLKRSFYMAIEVGSFCCHCTTIVASSTPTDRTPP